MVVKYGRALIVASFKRIGWGRKNELWLIGWADAVFLLLSLKCLNPADLFNHPLHCIVILCLHRNQCLPVHTSFNYDFVYSMIIYQCTLNKMNEI